MRALSSSPFLLLFLAVITVHAADDLTGYRTLQEAITTQVHEAKTESAGLAGYLGLSLEKSSSGGWIVDETALGSPAQKAGIKQGDSVLAIDGSAIRSIDDLRTLIQAHQAGDMIKIALQRQDQKLDVNATLDALSRPLDDGNIRPMMGVRMGTPSEAIGIPVTFVTTGMPASKAGVRIGDVILKVNEAELGEALSLTDKLSEYKPGDSVNVLIKRGDKQFSKAVTLAADENGSVPSEEQRTLKPWKKDSIRLAVLLVEFADTKHSDKIPLQEWQNLFFSRDTYHTTNATGQKTYGSVADYYHEASCGKLRVEGKIFDWVASKKNREEFNQGRLGKNRNTLFNEAVNALKARDGADALKDYDALEIIYAGARFPEANRGSLLWPHRSSVNIDGKVWPYVIVAEGGKNMANISVICHENGHVLGLPDLYARPENPGSEGAGRWCIMSNHNNNGQPQHFCAWSKEQLGWLTPAVIDPSVKQKLILSPIEGSDHECYKVLVRADGSEYFLLENRRKKGFDTGLLAEGLLIWRVVANRPILEESHGISGPSGPRVHVNAVPFPSKSNSAFTPYTQPSSRPQLAGGAAVSITNIRQLADGRITFEIGREFE